MRDGGTKVTEAVNKLIEKGTKKLTTKAASW